MSDEASGSSRSSTSSTSTREAVRFFGWSGAGFAVIIALVIGVSVGWGPAILVLAGAALIGTLFVVWRSIESLTEDAPLDLEEALSLAAPNEEEERKRSILRALRDLEYERAVGKLSDEDYHQLSQRYREEAKVLLRRIDEDLGPARARAERALALELFKAGLAGKPSDDESSDATDATDATDASEATKATIAPRSAPTTVPAPVPTRSCTYCGDRNRLLATFCASCGRELAEKGQRLCHTCPGRYPDSERACPLCGVEGGAT